MGQPKNVLLVTNCTTEEEIVLIRDAIDQANKQGLELKLSLVQVIPDLPACYFNIPSMVLLAERYYQEAAATLSTIAASLGTAKKDQWIITGRVKTEVMRLANKLDTHFILASSTNIQDLHKSFMFSRKELNTTPIRSINSLAII